MGQAGAAQTAAPTLLYVSPTGANSGTCPQTSPCATVSYALTQAASGATIKVSGTINDHLSISSPITITNWAGGPAGSPGVLDGTGSGIVVNVFSSGVTLNQLTIENGTLGINNNATGTLTLTNSTVSGNATGAEPYAGIANVGTMTIVDSTVTNNSGDNTYGSGIYNTACCSGDTGAITVIASTVSGNAGGGIYSSATARLAATIVAENTGSNCLGSNSASLVSAGYDLTNDTTGTACGFTTALDLVNKNPALGALASNGGPTKTMLPATSSPAADVIPNPTTLDGFEVCPGTDQRGVTRPGTGETRCTIGAAEVSGPKATTSKVTAIPATVTSGTRVAFLIVVKPTSGTGTPTGTVTFTIGSTKLCSAVLSGGDAACGATNAPVGTDTVTGTYAGGGGYAASSGTTTLTVN